MRERTFSARLGCRYLLHAPGSLDPRTVLVAALHGFGQNPEDMLRLTRHMVGPRHAIAAIEGPYAFFLGVGSDLVGHGWITNRRPADSIRLHHEMVGHVLEEAGSELAIPAERRVLLGFSQAVSLNYRFAAAYPESVRGVAGICGAPAYSPRCCTSRAARTSFTRPNARNNTRGVCVFDVMMWSSNCWKAGTVFLPAPAPFGRTG
ncbi:MAG: hypothetical protein NTW28_25830 [Candidatus Solibacter sp.]|nr:hypothetical protein [Candidatus Solibacter sp.]